MGVEHVREGSKVRTEKHQLIERGVLESPSGKWFYELTLISSSGKIQTKFVEILPQHKD